MSAQPTYAKLYFSTVTLSKLPFYLQPNFICPNCGHVFNPKYMPTAILPASYDFNQLVTFTCSNCQATISLYVAIHNDSNGLTLCVQRSDIEGAAGIPVNWWVKPVVTPP